MRQRVIASEAPTLKSMTADLPPRGGSFSVGRLSSNLPQPKGNRLFPELTAACFELEKLLCPTRFPSATIAINRYLVNVFCSTSFEMNCL
jgi:hypothetical protein